MDFLSQRQHGAPADDDVEAQGIRHSNGANYSNGENSGGSPGPNPGHNGAHVGDNGEHIKFGDYRMKPPASELNEYEALDRFITNHDQERRASLASGISKTRKQPKWWQFWKSAEGDAEDGPASSEIGKPPESWLQTDIHAGLTGAQVDERRRRYGWNELTAEKENMFAKILSYFQGPILYGERAPG